MSSNYEMCKFLARERVTKQRRAAEAHRLTRSAGSNGRSPPGVLGSILLIIRAGWHGLTKGRAKKRGPLIDASEVGTGPVRT